MKIGIIGAGNIGATAAGLFVKAGHAVAISNSRGPRTLQDLVKELGSGAQALSVEEAASFGDVVLISIPFGRYKQLLPEIFHDKIVIDTSNYYPERDGHIPEIDDGEITSSELLAKHLRSARIVKAFNTIWSEHLKSQGNTQLPLEDRRAIFIAGDDPKAKQTVSELIHEIGFSAVDTGTLRDGGRSQRPGSPIYNKVLTAKEAESLLKQTTINK